MALILASRSAARRAMLAAAGVPHEAQVAGVDEEAAKAALLADGLDARRLADALAELKAIRLSARRPGDLVLGCDSVVAAPDGTILDKPADRATARTGRGSGAAWVGPPSRCRAARPGRCRPRRCGGTPSGPASSSPNRPRSPSSPTAGTAAAP